MLVLSRRPGESIRVGDDVVITVIEIRADLKDRACKVRIGIDAPRDVSVHRSEVYDAIHKERMHDETQTRSGGR